MTKKLDDFQYYARIGVWPHIPNEVSPEAWLRNFTPDEKPAARHLLSQTLYLSNRLTKALLVSAIRNISAHPSPTGERLTREGWLRYLRSVVVAAPGGMSPGPSDSANMFAIWLKQLTPITEAQIVGCNEARLLLLDGEPRHLLFVDDIAGTGQQMTTTWTSRAGGPPSFAELHAAGRILSAFYTPVLATKFAVRNLVTATSGQLVVAPAQRLGNRHNASSANSLLYPDGAAELARAHLTAASERAGIPESRRLGYGGLGLAVAFEHAVPNNTLGLLWWDQNDWFPLFRRRYS